MTKRTLLAGATAFLLIGLAGFAWIWVAPCELGGCAPLEDLAEYEAEGSVLLDMQGEPFARLATVNRRITSLDSLPPHVSQAFIAIEDQRFYTHGGIDLWRTGGALLRNLKTGNIEQGASTITQQLARNLFPEWLPYTERNLRRKVLEARVARQIERALTKDKILELYLNHIYLGNGAYGIEAAANAYFGKPAAELTLAEAATLAGVPQAPSRVNPKEDLEASIERRDVVLDQMVVAGYLSPTEAEAAKAESVVVASRADESSDPAGSYFIEQVRREMEERVGSRLYAPGLTIHTSFDPTAQVVAERELARQLSAIEGGGFGTYRHTAYVEGTTDGDQTLYLQGAVIVLDASSGEVRALVGGRDFNDSKFNRATQAMRQPGSAFKPFVYAAALERFRSPVHRVEDSPLRLVLSNGQVWEPRNYTDEYDGNITMREALTRSKNAATVRLAQETGMEPVVRLARDLGIRSEIPSFPSTALGAAVVRPMELVAAYAPFANGGKRVEPHLIREIVDRHGEVVWRAPTRYEQVIDPAVAFVLTSMLADVVDRGTGSIVRAVGYTGPAAGKTGTTNEASDAWFIGYTPELVAGIWIGLDQPERIVRGASGGTLAAPVWGRMMRDIYASRPEPAGWLAPSGVIAAEVERLTGNVVSPECPPQGPTYTEYFIRSSPPRRLCHQYELRYPWMDSLWVDEEWSDLDFDSTTVPQPQTTTTDLDWPELDALRRRLLEAEEEWRDRQTATLESPTLPYDTASVPSVQDPPTVDPATPPVAPATPQIRPPVNEEPRPLPQSRPPVVVPAEEEPPADDGSVEIDAEPPLLGVPAVPPPGI